MMRLVYLAVVSGLLYLLPVSPLQALTHFEIQSNDKLTVRVTSDILEFIKSHEFENSISKPSVKHLEFQFEKQSSSSPNLNDYYQSIYNVSDAFVTNRPWWVIVKEPRSYDSNNYKVLFERVPPLLETFFHKITAVQYPSDCSSKKLHIRRYPRYFEYGNKIAEEELMAPYAYSRDMVFMVSVFNIGRGSAAFLEPGYCKLFDLNLCAHLPITNCSIPTICKSEKNCLDVENNFDKATEDGKIISPITDNINDMLRYDISHDVVYYAYRGFNDSSPMYIRHFSGSNIFSRLFTTGIGHRYNSIFRNLIAEEIHKMRITSKPRFLSTDACVAIHIRRHDRNLKGVKNMLDWCDKLLNHTCIERPGAPCKDIAGLACDLNPFGYIQFKHYLHAASALVPDIKNIFIMTDDGPWIEKHKHNFKHKYNIYSIYGSNYNTADSVANGVNFFASIEAARHCSAFVGHSRSAIYELMMSYMCTMHGPEGSRVYGECPIAFDFAVIGRDFAYDSLYLPKKSG